jgi:hypothetical protein
VVLAGAVTGLGLGLIGTRFVEPLFFQVKATDPSMLVLPLATVLAATLLASVVPVARAFARQPSQIAARRLKWRLDAA